MIGLDKHRLTTKFKDLVELERSLLQRKLAVSFSVIESVILLIPRGLTSITLDDYAVETTFVPHCSFLKVFYFIRQNTALQLKQLVDLVCIDTPGFFLRFTLMYIFVSPYFGSRHVVRLCTTETPTSSTVPSVSSIWQVSSWLEREVWDLFGVVFSNNRDLRRLLTDYSFRGYPLRKDFPLSGYYEIFYLASGQRITGRPVSLAQEYRNFSFSNPWLAGRCLIQ